MTPNQKKASALTLAVAFAAPMEGLRQMAYKDPVGIPTICFGTTRGVKLGDYKSVPECKALLTNDMQASVDVVDRCVKAPLTVNQIAAFADLTYNAGPTAVCDTSKSTMARKLRSGDIIGACRELLKWDKARLAGVLVALPGLTKRRVAEMDLCLKDTV